MYMKYMWVSCLDLIPIFSTLHHIRILKLLKSEPFLDPDSSGVGYTSCTAVTTNGNTSALLHSPGITDWALIMYLTYIVFLVLQTKKLEYKSWLTYSRSHNLQIAEPRFKFWATECMLLARGLNRLSREDQTWQMTYVWLGLGNLGLWLGNSLNWKPESQTKPNPCKWGREAVEEILGVEFPLEQRVFYTSTEGSGKHWSVALLARHQLCVCCLASSV